MPSHYLLGCSLLAVAATSSSAGDIDCGFKSSYPKQYVSSKTSEKLVMDGKLDEESWQHASFTDDFVDISTQTTPKFLTKAKILWDDEFLYIGAILQENQIWANISKTCHCVDPSEDQVIFHDNDFEIFVDPDGSTQYYKEFEMNAYNATWDLVLNKPYSDGGYENSSRVFGVEGFDMQPPLVCGVSIDGGTINDPATSPTTQGWTVEVAIPLISLAVNETVTVPPKDGTFWRINFSRVEWHVEVSDNQYYKYPCCQSCPIPGEPHEDNWVWSPMGEINMHAPDKWGLLQFSESESGSEPVFYVEWPIRHIAMTIYNAEHAFFNTYGSFTANVSALNDFASPPILENSVCSQQPLIESDGATFLAHVTDVSGLLTASIRNDRLLTMEYLAP